MPRITAQDFYDYDKCPHRVYMNYHGNPDEKLPLSDFLNLLFETALLHEQRIIHGLPFQSPVGETIEAQAESTISLMGDGVDRIYQGVLLLADDSGSPDLLERVPGNSRFGNYFYKPVDIKSGSGFRDEDKGTLREDYALQLCHYAELLKKIQGTFPPQGEILNKRGQRVPYNLAAYATDYAAVMPEVRALVEGTRSDEPVLSSHCGKCQWFGHCEPILEKANDVSLLPDIGRSKKMNLKQAGVVSIQDVSNFDFRTRKVPGFGPKTVDSIKRNARVVLSGKMELIQRPNLPNPALKVYFDFEDDPTQDLIYLAGMLFEPPREGTEFRYIFGPDEGGEGVLWRDFQALCVSIAKEDFLVFHYSSYEKSKITQLENKYGLAERAAVENFRSKMIDLHSEVEHSLALPTRS